jgi:hypothetical protein
MVTKTAAGLYSRLGKSRKGIAVLLESGGIAIKSEVVRSKKTLEVATGIVPIQKGRRKAGQTQPITTEALFGARYHAEASRLDVDFLERSADVPKWIDPDALSRSKIVALHPKLGTPGWLLVALGGVRALGVPSNALKVLTVRISSDRDMVRFAAAVGEWRATNTGEPTPEVLAELAGVTDALNDGATLAEQLGRRVLAVTVRPADKLFGAKVAADIQWKSLGRIERDSFKDGAAATPDLRTYEIELELGPQASVRMERAEPTATDTTALPAAI